MISFDVVAESFAFLAVVVPIVLYFRANSNAQADRIRIQVIPQVIETVNLKVSFEAKMTPAPLHASIKVTHPRRVAVVRGARLMGDPEAHGVGLVEIKLDEQLYPNQTRVFETVAPVSVSAPHGKLLVAIIETDTGKVIAQRRREF